MRFTIQQIPTKGTVFFHMNVLRKLSLQDYECVTLSIGAIREKVSLSTHDDQESVIYLSKDLFAESWIPEFLEYELTATNDVLYMGPVIGLLIRGDMEELDPPRVKIYKNYLADYDRLKGLVLLVTTDGIDPEKKTVLGFAYNPITNQWVKGTFPFPSVIFLRKKIGKRTRNLLEGLIGKHYFNSDRFDKWDMWEWLSNDKDLKKHVSETVLAKNLEEVSRLINKYKNIFLKPIFGMQGMGIYQLVKKDDQYYLHTRMNGKNFTSIFDSWDAVKLFLSENLNLTKFIAQQSIHLLKNEERVMDFRVIAVKDCFGNWSIPGVVTRFGERNSIVSNISSGGTAEKGWETFQKLYPKDLQEGFKKYKEIEKLSLHCCEFLDKKGLHLAYIGIDIGMDEERNLWVIEINNRTPDMTIALDAEDYQLYYKIKSAPLHYAKWLAGFRGRRIDAL